MQVSYTWHLAQIPMIRQVFLQSELALRVLTVLVRGLERCARARVVSNDVWTKLQWSCPDKKNGLRAPAWISIYKNANQHILFQMASPTVWAPSLPADSLEPCLPGILSQESSGKRSELRVLDPTWLGSRAGVIYQCHFAESHVNLFQIMILSNPYLLPWGDVNPHVRHLTWGGHIMGDRKTTCHPLC